MPDDVLNATIIYRRDLNPELAVVRIAPDAGQVPPFEPGQFCTIGLPRADSPPASVPVVEGAKPRPRMVRRAYSIASSAKVRDYYELYLVLVPEGKLTPRLWDIKQGGRIWLEEKAGGHFTLKDAPPGKDLVMISTGTGLAPFISMLKTYRGDTPRRWRRLVIVHGARVEPDLGYRDELEAIAKEDPTLVYMPLLTREPAGSPWKGLRGRVQTALEPHTYRDTVGAPLDPAQTEVYLCGNPDMIEDVRQRLEAQGFTTQMPDKPGTIHFERYW
ncbi:MAG: ferredoxin--NADP reductase [Planctomycetota bacterium]|nr:ferredoxin--NADP reductase [Planctomycetota bacterium]